MGASGRLRPGGTLWIVAQEYIPVGAMLARTKGYDTIELAACDGRFAVWTATVPGGAPANPSEKKGPRKAKKRQKEPSVAPSGGDEGDTVAERIAGLKSDIKMATDAGEY